MTFYLTGVSKILPFQHEIDKNKLVIFYVLFFILILQNSLFDTTTHLRTRNISSVH